MGARAAARPPVVSVVAIYLFFFFFAFSLITCDRKTGNDSELIECPLATAVDGAQRRRSKNSVLLIDGPKQKPVSQRTRVFDDSVAFFRASHFSDFGKVYHCYCNDMGFSEHSKIQFSSLSHFRRTVQENVTRVHDFISGITKNLCRF